MTILVKEPASSLAPRSESWSDRWFRFRNRLLANPRFQRWAARFPFTRFMARRRAAALFDLCAGFVYSQVLHIAVKVKLFEAMADGPLTVTELSQRVALSVSATQRLLDAAASLRLAERRGEGVYGLGIHGAALLANPAVSRMVEHHALLYRALSDPVALLRGEVAETELGRFWSYAGRGVADTHTSEQVASYSRLMADSLGLIADDLLEACPLKNHRVLLDVAGGEGAFVEAAARHVETLSVMLFDLPAVAARAERRLNQAGLAGRAKVFGGDLFRDPLPTGADVISLVRVVHDHDDAQALRILKAVRGALAPGGTLLLAEPMSGTTGAEPMGDAYFGFYLLAMGQGRPRTPEELQRLLSEAGFSSATTRKTRRPMLTALIVATA
jgi:demethylspheroidene O-methyltransferase